MKKILLLAAIMLTACTKDINMPSYSVKYHSEKLSGEFMMYSISSNDTMFAKFTPNYFDSTANQSLNILWLSINSEPEAYVLEERIQNGISTLTVSRAYLEWNRDTESWDMLGWITYDVIDTVMRDGLVDFMETQRQDGTEIWTFERI